jgi:pyruvate carboxylase subunit B
MFLKGEARTNVRKVSKQASADGSADGYTVTVNGKKYGVRIDGNKAVVNGKTYDVDIAEGLDASSAPAAAAGSGTEVKAPMPGLVLRIPVEVGDTVEDGEEVMVLEAMKMEQPVKAPNAGTVTAINVAQGDQVKAGQVLVELG